MNEKLQKNWFDLFSFCNVILKHEAKSGLKALCVVRDLFEKKSLLLVRLLKVTWLK